MTRWLSEASLRNRLLVSLITAAVLLYGLLAAASVRTEFLPSIDAPVTQLLVSYPGASPEVVESEVAAPSEAALQSVGGVREVASISSNGAAMIEVTFDFSVDPGAATDEVRQTMGGLTDLPAEAEVQVWSGSTDDIPVLSLAATADEDARTLAANVRDHILPEVEAIPGVREAQVFGQGEVVVGIEPDEDALEEEGLGTADIAEVLQSGGALLSGGTLEEGDRALSVEVGRQFDSLAALADLHMTPAPGPDADPVRLDDVAEIRWSMAPAQSQSRVNGEDAVSIIVYKTPEANTVEVSQAVNTTLTELEQDLGSGGEIVLTFDSAPFIEDSLSDLVEKGLVGLAIAIALIFAFLLSVRTTLITAVSIPLSLLIAVIALWQGGHTLNMLTLAALTAAVGRVVDDSIVVLENIRRHLSYGIPKLQAVRTGVREVAGAITVSTLTTVAVFLPLAFVSGEVGELFRPFALASAAALLASLLVALTIVPVLAYWAAPAAAALVQEQEQVQKHERNGPLQRCYLPMLHWVLRRGDHGWRTWRRWTALGTAGLLLLLTFALAGNLRFTFLDDDGQYHLVVDQQLPPGTSLAAMSEAAHEVEEVLSRVEEVLVYETIVGSDGFLERANQASFWVTIDPEGDLAKARAAIEDGLAGLDDAGETSIATLLAVGGTTGDETVEVTVRSSGTAVLEESADLVAEMLSDLPGLGEVTSDLAEEEPGIAVTPRDEEVAEYGITDRQIAQTAQHALNGLHVGTAPVAGVSRPFHLYSTDVPSTVEELREYSIITAEGPVELGEVAEIEEVDRPAEIVRSEGQRSVTLSAAVTGEDLAELNRAVEAGLADLELPSGAGASLGGATEQQAQAQDELLGAIAAAVLMVLVIMVAAFRSLAQPLILLAAVPFASTGAIAALLVTDTAMSVSAMIGLLMLVGIVVTNAIVLIDLVNQYRSGGMPLHRAVVEGSRHRLRPIVMTALATIGAMLPLAAGWGTGSVFIAQPLALVVIGGLVTSTVLTLLLVPALYVMVEEGKQNRLHRRASAGKEAAAADGAG